MKQQYILYFFFLVICLLSFQENSFAQNVGIGINNPVGKLHIKGSANVSQLVIDANSTQDNSNPLIKLRNSIGTDLLWIHSDDTSNTFIGLNAGRLNNAASGGTSNTSIGGSSLFSNTVGSANTAVGTFSLKSNTEGYFNAALGYRSLYSNTTGGYNSAVGQDAMFSNTTGVANSALGNSAFYSNTTGSFNTAVGQSAMFSNTNGHDNAALGYDALSSNSTGDYNAVVGISALRSNTGGNANTALGTVAMYANTTGEANTATGAYSLGRNITGYDNTAYGYSSLYNNSTGAGNTAIGSYALQNTTASYYNTTLGFFAGYYNNLGWNNTLIGAESYVTASGFYNSIALGNSSTVTTSNQARIGNSATTSIGGYQNWTSISDGRYKKNIHEDIKGLDFIMKLRPVTYQLDISGIGKKLNENKSKAWNEDMQIAVREKEKIIQSGFIAQEVETAAKELGYDFSGVDKPKNENDLYGLRYAEFVVPLVKGMQEQQLTIEELKKANEIMQRTNALQKNLVEDLLKRIQKLETSFTTKNEKQ